MDNIKLHDYTVCIISVLKPIIIDHLLGTSRAKPTLLQAWFFVSSSMKWGWVKSQRTLWNFTSRISLSSSMFHQWLLKTSKPLTWWLNPGLAPPIMMFWWCRHVKYDLSSTRSLLFWKVTGCFHVSLHLLPTWRLCLYIHRVFRPSSDSFTQKWLFLVLLETFGGSDVTARIVPALVSEQRVLSWPRPRHRALKGGSVLLLLLRSSSSSSPSRLQAAFCFFNYQTLLAY